MVLHTALCVIATNINAKTGDDKVMLRAKNYSNELSNSRANNSTCSGPITPILTLSQTTNFRLFQTERVCRQQFQI